MKTCFTNVSHYKRFVHLCSENVLNSLRMEPATETMSVVKDRTVSGRGIFAKGNELM